MQRAKNKQRSELKRKSQMVCVLGVNIINLLDTVVDPQSKTNSLVCDSWADKYCVHRCLSMWKTRISRLLLELLWCSVCCVEKKEKGVISCLRRSKPPTTTYIHNRAEQTEQNTPHHRCACRHPIFVFCCA